MNDTDHLLQYNMSNNNQPATPVFKSLERGSNLRSKPPRKYSAQQISTKKQQDILKAPPGINSDLQLSIIQKKVSQTSDISGMGIDKLSSPKLKSKGQPSSFLRNNSNVTNSPQQETKSNRQIKQNIIKEQKLRRQNQIPQQNCKRQKQNEEQEEEFNNYQFSLQGSINWKSIWQFLKLIFFSYQFNLLDYLRDMDPALTQQVIDIIKIAPGYKPIQYVYMFYALKYGVVAGIVAALIYPLPYSILFLMITVDLNVPFICIFMLAGMRSGTLALLLKYCMHFPRHGFHWIVLVFTVLIGILFQNNYIYILLFVISIFLSFYIRQPQSRSSISDDNRLSGNSINNPAPSLLNLNTSILFNNNFNQLQIYKCYRVYDKMPQTYPNLNIALLTSLLIFLWVLQRYFQNRQLSIFSQVVPISMLANSKQILAFFPYIYQQAIGTSTLSASTLISLSFLLPGPHIKVFMFFIIHTQIKNVVIGYVCLYLPSLLLMNIFIGYRPYFYTSSYYNIRQSIQAAGNGIVFCLVIEMLRHQVCFFNSVCYSAVVIMVVAKLYKLRELFAITLGVFLISVRTIILNINKDIPFEQQACLNETLSDFL